MIAASVILKQWIIPRIGTGTGEDLRQLVRDLRAEIISLRQEVISLKGELDASERKVLFLIQQLMNRRTDQS